MTESEFYRFYDRLPDALLLISPDGVVCAANVAAASALACSRQDLIGRTFVSLISASATKINRYLSLSRGSRDFIPGSFSYRDAAGNAVDFRCDAALVSEGTGHVLLRFAPRVETNRRFFLLSQRIDQLAHEIGERKRAEELLAGHNEVLELIAQDKPLSAVLERLASLLEEYSGGEMLASILLLDADGRRLRHGAAPSLPDSYTRALDGVLIGPGVGSCGTAAYRAQPVIVTDIENDPLWVDFKDLALAHGLCACWSAPICGSGGGVLGTFAMYYPAPRTPRESDRRLIALVTRTAAIAIERHAARERTTELLQQREAMLDGLPARIALLDEHGIVRSVNKGWTEWQTCGLIDCRIDVGTSFLDCCDLLFGVRDDEEPVSTAVLDVLSGNRSFVLKQCVSGTASAVRWLRLSVAAVSRHTGSRDAIAMHVDITDAKTAEETLAQQASELAAINAELQQFAYVASHDLREPLRTIKSFAQLFVRKFEGQVGAEEQRFLDYITDGVGRMENLLEDLLVYSRVAHRAELEMVRVDLNDCLAAALRNLHAIIQETGTVISAGKLPVVKGYPTQLTQLLQNLISNAVKYRSEAPPRIELRAERAKDGWKVLVSDNGMGIEPRYHDVIFGLFKRLHSQQVPGTGIGLALCRKIAEAHRGRIWVESTPGSGSSFCFTIGTEADEDLPSARLMRGHA